jgi:hypothetical protein
MTLFLWLANRLFLHLEGWCRAVKKICRSMLVSLKIHSNITKLIKLVSETIKKLYGFNLIPKKVVLELSYIHTFTHSHIAVTALII